jgi:ArsR family transcriptional regulator
MGDDTRQEILKILIQGEMSVTEIVESFNISQPAISHHLNILHRIGLISRRKEGKQVFYAINRDRVVECCGQLIANFDEKEVHIK